MDNTVNLYSQPSYQGGANFPLFAGSRRQRGGSLGRMFAHIEKRVGKKLLSYGVCLARNVAEDILSGKNIKE